MKILIFGGTTEAVRLAVQLAGHGFETALNVATEYGRHLVPSVENLVVMAQKLDANEMTQRLRDGRYDYVIDATHPYARLATQNIEAACRASDTNYLRLRRDASGKNSAIAYVADYAEAVRLLNSEPGNILVTTGSKELSHFTAINNFASRCFVRILPMMDSIQKVIDLGFCNSQIIAMQGPFDETMNLATIRMTKAKFLVTKDSGETGGFEAKISAAIKAGCRVIVIDRPTAETGLSLAEMLAFFEIKHCDTAETTRETRFFPLPVDFCGRHVLVVGGGKIARRRIEILHSFGAKVTVISPGASPGLENFAERGTIQYVNRRYQRGDVARFRPFLVIAATDDREVNRAVAAEAGECETLVIVSDARDECDCFFPAIAESDDYLAGIVSKTGDHHGVRMIAEKIRQLFHDNDEH